MKYLNKLSSSEIYNFLNDNDIIVLDYDLKSLIEEAQKNNGENIYLRCLDLNKNDDNKVEGFMYKCFKNAINPTYSSSNLEMFILNDFTIYRLLLDFESVTDRDRLLNERYVEFMKSHSFYSEYEKDYEKYIESLKAETENVR